MLGTLLVLLLVIVLTGLASEGAIEFEGPFVSWFMDLSVQEARLIMTIHHLASNLLLLLIGAHLAGLFIDHVIHKTGVIRSMFTGYKAQKHV